jgi:3-oxoacyl-[acyl-carrier-protein] synthase-3
MIPLISHKVYKNVLIIATEAYSKHTNWNDQHSVFFGDGAGAIILSYDEDGWMSFESNANGKDTGMTGFNMPLNAPFIMKGKEVWEQAVKVLPTSIKNILKKSNTKVEDVSMLIPHQPSINILKIVADEVGLPMDKVKTVMHKYANIAGASIPIALNDAVMNNQINKGNIIIFTTIGSGWAWGSTIMKWIK